MLTSTVIQDGLILDTSERGSAIFSPDRLYRYLLTRPLAPSGPKVLYGMLNPSTAGAEENDSTITRCISFARQLEASSLSVVNMGAYIATDPDELPKAADPLGPSNRRIVADAAAGADIVIAAWGALSPKLRKLFKESVTGFVAIGNLKCLGKTKHGDPHHPLYLPRKVNLTSWP